VLWPDYYKNWRRAFSSPSPTELTITDDYELLKGEGVEFRWHTPLPVTNKDGLVVITGSRGRAVITPPEGAKVEIIAPRDLGCRKLSTIVFFRPGSKGTLTTKVKLEAAAAQ
jgi:hypothetical protein